MAKLFHTCSWLIIAKYKLRQAIIKSLHTTLKRPISYIFVYSGSLLRLLGFRNFGLKLLLKGRRINNVASANRTIKNIIRQNYIHGPKFEALLISDPKFKIENIVSRVLILKLPIITNNNITEKGAIIFKFSETFTPAYLFLNLKILTKYFRVILEPSSVGYSLPEILAWSNLGTEKIIVLSPYYDDFDFLLSTTTNLIPIKLGPADWVDSSKFYKIPNTHKEYDSLYVANFNPIKRVERYIQAVVNINRFIPNYKAALVCAGFGTAQKEVLAILECAKMRNVSIEIFSKLNQNELNALFNNTKVNVLISLREGANKGLAEGLFAGAPALLIKENVGGNHLHINQQTGCVIPDAKIEEALIWFTENYNKFTPHEWAIEHISPLASSKLLSDKLKEIEESEGRIWTKDIFIKINKPELNYLYEENHWLLSERLELLTIFSDNPDETRIIDFLQNLKQKTMQQSKEFK